MEVEFMTADTPLPPCMPLPRAMLRLPISSTAKVMYARMLDIVFVSGIEDTHRLCTRAAMLESYLPHPEAITDEQVSLFLKLLFHKDSTRQLMEKVFTGNGNFQGEDAGRKRP